ncbi:hypothetical protein CC2G_002812 [Coprinopsis cinerea AmutBmut pab1-1]|nr:hypothetical protein CC2G_002812 [Coprinopsis cinerea AmutBmut pab1-1]
MSTLSGRMEWRCGDSDAGGYKEQGEVVARVRALILQSWDGVHGTWSKDLFVRFQESEDALISKGAGAIELHWLTPSMPLEQNSLIIFAYIAFFTIVPIGFTLAATHPLGWQEARASALLLGGQAVLSLGHFLAQWVLGRQRTSVYVELPRRNFADSWMLVDNTWFTGNLARRRVSNNSLAPGRMTVGQHVSINPVIPAWQALVILLAIAAGFLAFYIGARSSHLYVVLFLIGTFFFGNLLKGYIITVANQAYVTPLNNPGYENEVVPLPERRTWMQLLTRLFDYLQSVPARFKRKRRTNAPDADSDVEFQGAQCSHSIGLDEKNGFSPDVQVREVEDQWTSEVWPEALIPLPSSEVSLHRQPSTASSSSGSRVKERPRNDTYDTVVSPSEPQSESAAFGSSSKLVDGLESPLNKLENEIFVPVNLNEKACLKVDESLPLPELKETEPNAPPPVTGSVTNCQHRVYAKIALRRHDSIGLFYFSSAQIWGVAAHIIYETLHDKIQWDPHMRKEPLLILPFEFYERTPGSQSGASPGIPTSATLILALDETINEDVFWMAGMEFVTILCGAFTDRERLVSEYEESTRAEYVAAYVHYVTKYILQAYVVPEPEGASTMVGGTNNLLLQAPEVALGDRLQRVRSSGSSVGHGASSGQELAASAYPGVASMMRAIDLVRRKYAFDSSVFAVPQMRQFARSAVEAVLGPGEGW